MTAQGEMEQGADDQVVAEMGFALDTIHAHFGDQAGDLVFAECGRVAVFLGRIHGKFARGIEVDLLDFQKVIEEFHQGEPFAIEGGAVGQVQGMGIVFGEGFHEA